MAASEMKLEGRERVKIGRDIKDTRKRADLGALNPILRFLTGYKRLNTSLILTGKLRQ